MLRLCLGLGVEEVLPEDETVSLVRVRPGHVLEIWVEELPFYQTAEWNLTQIKVAFNCNLQGARSMFHNGHSIKEDTKITTLYIIFSDNNSSIITCINK